MIVKDNREKRIVEYNEILIGEVFARYHEGFGSGDDGDIFIKSDELLAIQYSKDNGERHELQGIVSFRPVTDTKYKYRLLNATLTIS